MSDWRRLRRARHEGDPAHRTWYRKRSDGTFFRNCPLIMAEREDALRRAQYRRCKELGREWDECFRDGIITAGEIDPGDRWIDYDDSPEANARWVKKVLAERDSEGDADA
jgi:hypothetical protein